MKTKVFNLLVILALVALVGFTPMKASAQAYSTSFTTSITYQNVGTAATTSLQVQFYASPDSTTPITVPLTNLGAGESTSLFIGSVSQVVDGFQGSAVMSSDQPLLATLVQVPQNSTTVFVRPLSNGFSSGSTTALVATVLKNYFGSNTIFSIQNVDAAAVDVNIKFYNTSAALVHEIDQNIEAGAAFYVDAAQVSQLGASFNGSAVATSAGNIIGSAMELDITGNGAKAFETVATGANTLYMPSALCNVFGGQNTSYAVQNTSLTDDADVTVTFNPGGLTATANIGAGAKASFPACNTVAANFSGSATITSVGAPVVAMGKAYGAGLSTAFLGAPNGFADLALPYVRWAPDTDYNAGSRQRTYIAIQNVGAASIPANSIVLTYTDAFGHTGTHTYDQALAVGAKFNSNASNAGLTWFGYATPPASGFGGGVSISCSVADCQLIAVARVATYMSGQTLAEDYNAMPIP